MFKNIWLIIPPLLFIIMMFTLAFVFHKQEMRTIKYDCSYSEISPDFPIEVKEHCRKMRSGRI